MRILVEFSTSEIRFGLMKEEHEQVRKAMEKYNYRPCIERALTVLTVFAGSYAAREEIPDFLRRELFDLP